MKSHRVLLLKYIKVHMANVLWLEWVTCTVFNLLNFKNGNIE